MERPGEAGFFMRQILPFGPRSRIRRMRLILINPTLSGRS